MGHGDADEVEEPVPLRLQPTRVDRIAQIGLVTIPSAAVLCAGFALLGPGSPRAVVGARVWAAPSEGAPSLALRIETVRRDVGVDEPAPSVELLVEALAGDGRGDAPPLATWRGRSNDHGIADASLDAAAGPTRAKAVRITSAGRVLAEGRLDEGAARAASPAAMPNPLRFVEGKSSGDFALRVEIARGTVAAPFEAALLVHAERLGAGVVLDDLRVEAVGADVLRTERAPALPPRSTESAIVTLRPTFHRVDLSLVAERQAGGAARWEGRVPVSTGSIWVAPAAPGLPPRVVAPAPMPRAYVSFFCGASRFAGGAVELRESPTGFFEGLAAPAEIALATCPEGAPRALRVASDPFERGTGATAWPLAPERGYPAPPALEAAVDGLVEVEQAERARARRPRRVVLYLIGAAAVAEILLMLHQRIRYSRRLRAQAAGAAGLEDDRRALEASLREPALRFMLAACLVGFAFALIASLVTVLG